MLVIEPYVKLHYEKTLKIPSSKYLFKTFFPKYFVQNSSEKNFALIGFTLTNLTTVKSTLLLFAIRTVVHIFCCCEMRVTHEIALNPKVEKGQDTNKRRKK